MDAARRLVSGYVLRLFRRAAGQFNEKQVHEGVQINGEIGRLHNHLVHYTDRNLQHYFEKFNRYTSLAAEDLNRQGKRFHLWDLLFRPFWFFLRMYVFKAGFLDGLHGFVPEPFGGVCVYEVCQTMGETEMITAFRNFSNVVCSPA
jgi:hypothetical protein